MRPKATFREEGKKRLRKRRHQPLAAWPSEYAITDDCDEDLLEIIQDYRCLYELVSKITNYSSVRHTLLELQKLDDGHLLKAIYLVDDRTEAQIAAGELRYRKSCKLSLPPDFDLSIYRTEELRVIVQYAIDALPVKPGRTSTKHRDIELALMLARYWLKKNRKLPTITRDSETGVQSDFMRFAMEQFRRVGRPISNNTLYPILRVAVRNLKRGGFQSY